MPNLQTKKIILANILFNKYIEIKVNKIYIKSKTI